MPNHNWTLIRQEYVEGINANGRIVRPSLRELAARHGVIGAKVRTRAAREGWAAERRAFVERVKEARATVRVDALAQEGAAFDRRMFDIARGLMDIVERMQRAMSASGKTTDPIELVRLGQAARHAQIIAAVALGERDPDEAPPLPATGAMATATVRVVYERSTPP